MTPPASLDEWLASRTPPVPEGFRMWMRPSDGRVPATVETIVFESRRGLARASDPQDRLREGAFDLLAADGFATYACECALEGPEPDTALVRVLEMLLE